MIAGDETPGQEPQRSAKGAHVCIASSSIFASREVFLSIRGGRVKSGSGRMDIPGDGVLPGLFGCGSAAPPCCHLNGRFEDYGENRHAAVAA
jgi:hypothetical protein